MYPEQPAGDPRHKVKFDAPLQIRRRSRPWMTFPEGTESHMCRDHVSRACG